MRKAKYLLVSLLSVMLITGCFSKGEVEKAGKKVSEALNYNIVYKYDIATLSNNLVIESSSTTTVLGSSDSNAYIIDTTSTMSGEVTSTKTYVEDLADSYVNYDQQGDKYEKMIENKKELSDFQKKVRKYELDITKFEELIAAAKSSKKVTSDIDGTKEYELVIGKNAINDFVNYSYSDFLGENSIADDVTIYVYTNKDVISKIKFSLIDHINLETVSTKFSKYNVEIDIKDLNVTNVSIPAEVKNASLAPVEGEE